MQEKDLPHHALWLLEQISICPNVTNVVTCGVTVRDFWEPHQPAVVKYNHIHFDHPTHLKMYASVQHVERNIAAMWKAREEYNIDFQIEVLYDLLDKKQQNLLARQQEDAPDWEKCGRAVASKGGTQREGLNDEWLLLGTGMGL